MKRTGLLFVLALLWSDYATAQTPYLQTIARRCPVHFVSIRPKVSGFDFVLYWFCVR